MFSDYLPHEGCLIFPSGGRATVTVLRRDVSFILTESPVVSSAIVVEELRATGLASPSRLTESGVFGRFCPEVAFLVGFGLETKFKYAFLDASPLSVFQCRPEAKSDQKRHLDAEIAQNAVFAGGARYEYVVFLRSGICRFVIAKCCI